MFEDIITKEPDEGMKPLRCQNPEIKSRFPQCGNGVDSYCHMYPLCAGFPAKVRKHTAVYKDGSLVKTLRQIQAQ